MKKYRPRRKNGKKTETVVLVTGGYDPLHIGHLLSFKAAKALGDKLIVAIDGNEYLRKKMGAPFLPIEDRVAIIQELRCVDQVIVIGDGDMSDAILAIKPDILANGGDRSSIKNLLKKEVGACRKIGCRMIFNVGGGKIRSSSDLLRQWVHHQTHKKK